MLEARYFVIFSLTFFSYMGRPKDSRKRLKKISNQIPSESREKASKNRNYQGKFGGIDKSSPLKDVNHSKRLCIIFHS
jgi:hypothetical protein